MTDTFKYNINGYLVHFLQPDLPKVIDHDEDDESEEQFEEHMHSLIDYVEVQLVSSDEIAKHQP